LPLGTLEGGKVVSFDPLVRGIEHLPPRNDDDVEAGSAAGSAKYFTGEAFGAVSIDGGSDLPGRGHSKAPRRPVISQDEQGHESPVYANALPVDPFELRSAADAMGGGQLLAAHADSSRSGITSRRRQ
jgi:hypothetical protein